MVCEAIIIVASQLANSAFFLAAAWLAVFLTEARWVQVDRMPNGPLGSSRWADG
jgi:hypothetical protein